MARTLLVTGAAGHLGRQVLAELVQKKLKDTRIIAATRDPQKLKGLDGVEVVRADFDDEASLAVAFKGVDRLLLISTDALDRPGRRQEQHKRAIAAAAAAGVKHVLYTSIVNPNKDSPMGVAEDHRLTEAALVAEPRLGHTILRNNLYMDLLLGSLPGAFGAGALYAASGDGKFGYVTRADCARAAAAALAADFDGRRVIDVTGPAAVSNAEIAALASSIAGKPLPFVALTPEQARGGLEKAGFPPPIAALFVSFDEGAAKGELNVVSTAVKDLTGTAATDLKTFLTANKAAWVK
jgi:NAD(P)H dehydrogenase (quinone)